MTSQGPVQHCLRALVLLLCFSGIFYMYFRPDLSWLTRPNAEAPVHDVCIDACLTVLKTEDLTQSMNSTCTLNYTLVKSQLSSKKTAIMEEYNGNVLRSKTLVLIWVWPFGSKFGSDSCGSLYGIEGCHLTDNRSLYDKAHSVMFHLRDVRGDLPSLQQMPRPPRQKWVWMNMESPANSAREAAQDNLFNLTANYRRDADVWVPYGHVVEVSDENNDFQIPTKDKLVCWIVSNWNHNFKRVQYFEELSRHIAVEAYGRHFGKYVSDADFSTILSSCKFYLSFENSVHKDYITEKLFNPMIHGTVPVVLGPPRDNYEEFVPADSFIHVDDFKNPQELAEHLKLLDQNQEMYERYFAWRKHYVARRSFFGLEHACRICDHVKRNKGYRVFKNLNRWYWG